MSAVALALGATAQVRVDKRVDLSPLLRSTPESEQISEAVSPAVPEPAPPAAPQTLDDIFLEEARGHLQTLLESYAALDADPVHGEAVRLLGEGMTQRSTTEQERLLGHADAKSTEMYQQLALRKLTRVSDKSNLLSKIKTPVSALLAQLKERGR